MDEASTNDSNRDHAFFDSLGGGGLFNVPDDRASIQTSQIAPGLVSQYGQPAADLTQIVMQVLGRPAESQQEFQEAANWYMQTHNGGEQWA